MNPSSTNDFYQRLGISCQASEQEKKSAYRELSMKWHPDHNPPERKRECELEFIAISEAYKELSSEAREIFERDPAGKTPDYEFYNKLYQDMFDVLEKVEPGLGKALRMLGMDFGSPLFHMTFNERE